MSTTYPNRLSCLTTAISTTVPACDVGIWLIATNRASCTLHDLGDLKTGRPIDLWVTYSSHSCSKYRKSFNVDLSDLALPGSHDTRRVIQLAVRLGVEDGLPHRPASWHLWRDHRVFVPFTIQNWVEAGKKGAKADGQRLSGLGTGVVFGLRGRR